MSRRLLSAMSAATALTFVFACANDRTTPLSPGSAGVEDTQAAADGSTLKVTAPAPISPASGEDVQSARPQFRVTNSQVRFAGAAALSYRFEIQTDGGSPVFNGLTDAGSGATGWDAPRALDQGAFRWRARAEMGSKQGPWSAFVPFRIVAPPSLLPPGPYPRDPEAIVKFVEASYPERGRARVSLAKRKEDMAFLRDRIIEVGLCVGHVMGRNLKRGGPEHSFDFLAWKHSGKTWGVDIAGGYDDTSDRLVLSWSVHAPRAFFDPLPNPEACRN
jgi:hypothetical protein